MIKDNYYTDEKNLETVESVSQYVKYIESFVQQLKSDMNRDEYLAFRGQCDKDYQLIPSIGRTLKYKADVQVLHFEKELVYAAQHEYPKEFINVVSPVELLVKLQHFGIPTRLLDITTNALVALYFACSENEQKDGEVFVLKLKRDYHWNAPLAELIADTYRLELEEKSIEEYYEIYKKQSYFSGKNPTIRDEYEEDINFYQFRNDLYNSWNEPIVIQPPRTFSRLNIQSGQFLLFMNSLYCEKETNLPIEIGSEINVLKKNHKYICGRVRIPNNVKSNILRELAVLGITRSTLFHDNIDVVCKGIVENINYRTKNGAT